MKICGEQQTKKVLIYEDLREGDIFSIKRKSEKVIAIKTGTGYSYLVSKTIVGRYIQEYGEAMSGALIRYPNACIILGDPE